MVAQFLSTVSRKQNHFTGLISQAARDNQQAFGKLYAMFQPRVFRFLNRSSGDAWLADELTNQTFQKAFRCLSGFRGNSQGQFQSFLLTTAANLLRDHHRRSRPLELGLEEHKVSEQGTDYNDRSEYSGPAALQARERSAMLRDALACLAPEQAMLISLAHFDDLSAGQIATILHKPSPQAVRAALSRAIKHLRQVLLRQGYFSPAPA